MQTEKLKRHYSFTQQLLGEITGLLLILPLSPFICRFIPPVFLGDWNIDLAISVIIAIIIVRLLLWLIKPIIVPAFVLIAALLVYSDFTSAYTFKNIAKSYQTLITQNWGIREQKQIDDLSFNPYIFENIEARTSRMVSQKVQYKDSLVRNFSVEHSLDYFDDYYYKYKGLTRYLSLFKYINNHFKYVSDVNRDEYYATPRETILNGLGGDCDDHSILMASCLMSIGATCRLVVVEGHMYPELYVGNENDFDIMQQAIVQLFDDEKIDKIYYHENKGQYWINLDYTGHYPGAPYMNDKVILLINP